MSTTASHNMKYRFLGNSGLLVSRLSFGSWVTFDQQLDFEKAYSIMEHAYKQGINFFDNAEVYENGRSELVMGKVVKAGIERGAWSREDLVISTKLFFGTKSGPNDVGNSRKHIVEGMEASLKRFDLDYVDLVFCHRSDPATPIEETVRAMNFLIEQGWAFYWGTSEWCAKDIIEACEIADRLGLIRPVYDQPQYHILERSRVEYDFDVLYKKYNYGLTTWSPLASGVLTGKYSKGIPEGSRLSMSSYKQMLSNGLEEKIAKADKLAEVAKEVGCSLAQLSIAWVASNPHVSTVILGATSIKQLDENLKALEYVDKITPEVREKIDAIADFKPKLVAQAEPFVINLRQKWL
ncbi:putative voltage-gated potassium channel subunit beta [Phytophthora rubi]|uniref:Putative voltage-gated potassium channel subunit beta n=1 Tax=Phytophthora rubi TaxID=129364 RepID=A0A6A3L9J9_9STRA|nr:putative voltage-gated potassium channel subunit beta [Phytophthora rubi]